MNYHKRNFFPSIFADHSVHAPSYTTDPWNIDFPPDTGYTIKSVDGVFNLFRDSKCTDNLNYPYLKMDDFVQDMQTMCTMMADGPLWVQSQKYYLIDVGINFPIESFSLTESRSAIVGWAICTRNSNCTCCSMNWESWLHRRLYHTGIFIIFGNCTLSCIWRLIV